MADFTLACRFEITPQTASLDDSRIRDLLEKATVEAVEEATKDGYSLEARPEVEGGFGGIGELTVLILLLSKSAAVAKGAAIAKAVVTAGAKAGGKAAIEGIAGATAKLFFDKYLKPRLLRLNLLPSEPRISPSGMPAKESKRRNVPAKKRARRS